MCRLRNIAFESVTDGRTDRRTTDKVIPMCRYASQATQKKKNTMSMSIFKLDFYDLTTYKYTKNKNLV